MTIRRFFEILIILVLFGALGFVGYQKLAAYFYSEGERYHDQKSYTKAIDAYQKSLRLKSDVPQVHYNLGCAYEENNMPQQAVEEFRKTIHLDPKSSVGYIGIADIYLKDKKYVDALDILHQAEGVSTDDAALKAMLKDVSYQYMSDCLGKGTDAYLAGNKSSGYALMETGIKAYPDFPFAHYTLAFFYFNDRNYESARKSLEKALQIDAKFTQGYKLLGDVYFAKGAYEKAIETYKKTLSLGAKDANLYNDIGLTLMQLERYGDAVAYLQEAVRLAPDNLGLRFNFANTCRDNGMTDKAIEQYSRIISANPVFPNIHTELGDAYRILGREQEALEQYQIEIGNSKAYLEKSPNEPVYLNNLAYALNASGQSQEAKEIIQKAISAHSSFRQAYLTLAKINDKLGDQQAALQALETARSLSYETNFIDREISQIKKELSGLQKK